MAELYSIPVVLYFHTIPTRFKSRTLISLLIRKLIRRSSNVLLGNEMKVFFSRNFGAEKIFIIPNTVTDPESRDAGLATQIEERKFRNRFAFLSNLQPEKGLEEFIEFAAHLCVMQPSAKFIVIGPVVDTEYMKSIHAKITQLNLEHSIDFKGYITGKEKFALLLDSDFLIFTSRLIEGQPLSILESISMGTPVLSFPSGGAKDLVKDRISGFVSADLRVLASKIEYYNRNPDLYLSLRKSTLNFYRESYSFEHYQLNWEKLIREFLI